MKKKKIRGNLIWYGSLILTMLFLRNYVMHPVIIKGNSMEPTLSNHEFLFALKCKEIKRFDVVSFTTELAPKATFIKRVIGLPGDSINYNNDHLYINGVEFEEPYLADLKREIEPDSILTELNNYTDTIYTSFGLKEITGVDRVPEGSYFVLGDNRRFSMDSRWFGFISEHDIKGKLKLTIWPPSRIGTVE